jgi:hypothetical protein
MVPDDYLAGLNAAGTAVQQVDVGTRREETGRITGPRGCWDLWGA